MTNLMNYVEDRQTSEFYPTPEKLVKRMLGKVKWDLVQTILEPSAGKGDIVRGIATAPMRDYHKDRLDVDCIELDPNLRSILKYSFSEEAKREIFGKKSALIKTRASYEKKAMEKSKWFRGVLIDGSVKEVKSETAAKDNTDALFEQHAMSFISEFWEE